MKPDPRQLKALTDMACPKVKKGIADIPRYTKVSKEVFFSYSRRMQVTKMTHISEDIMDVE